MVTPEVRPATPDRAVSVLACHACGRQVACTADDLRKFTFAGSPRCCGGTVCLIGERASDGSDCTLVDVSVPKAARFPG